jgi:uncharacterized protein
MKNAIIIHGRPDKEEYYDPLVPSCSNSHWFPWIQKQLLSHDIPTQTPEIPNSFDPQYDVWKKEFERFDITPETILVGHSCGGGFLVRWLSKNKNVTVGKVVLVAPWIDPDRDSTTDFFDFTIDPDLVKRTKRFIIFHSDNDYVSIQKTVKILRDTVKGTEYREFQNYGHFCIEDMKTPEFPELLEVLIR